MITAFSNFCCGCVGFHCFSCLQYLIAPASATWLYFAVAHNTINLVAVVATINSLWAEVHLEFLALEIKYLFWTITVNSIIGHIVCNVGIWRFLLLQQYYRYLPVGEFISNYHNTTISYKINGKHTFLSSILSFNPPTASCALRFVAAATFVTFKMTFGAMVSFPATGETMFGELSPTGDKVVSRTIFSMTKKVWLLGDN